MKKKQYGALFQSALNEYSFDTLGNVELLSVR